MAEEPEIKPKGCLQKVSHVVETTMSGFFTALGGKVARSPGRTVLLAFVCVAIGMSGFNVLETESRGDKLWLPTGTRAQDDYATYLSNFPKRGRENLVIMVPSNDGNILTQDNLILAMDLFQSISDFTVVYEGQEYELEDLCVESAEFSGTTCTVESVLGKWEYDVSVLGADTSVLDTLEKFLGGVTLSDDGTEVIAAEALRMMFVLKNTEVVDGGSYFDPIPDTWESQFIDTGLACVDSMTCYVEATRSLSDEFGDAVQGDISLISGSYLIILVYTIINLSGRPLLKSRILLSLGAIMTVGLSIAFSIGLAAYFGFFYTPLHTVLPFVLLGLGVDDSFVICNAFGRTDPRKPISERMAEGLGTSGVSISVTSITDVVAFIISASTVLPALSSFCVYAALGVLAVYALQSTLFVALVVYDARRQEAGRSDCCPCFKTKNMDQRSSALAGDAIAADEPWDPALGERGRLEKFVGNVYAPALTKKPVKALVVGAFLVIFGFCAYGASKLEVSDTAEAFIPDGSYLLDTKAARERWDDSGMTGSGLAGVSGQLTGIDASSPYIQDPTTSGTFFSWFDDLVIYAQDQSNATLVTSGGATVFSNEDEFYSSLKAFLSSPDGVRYNSSVILEASDGSVSAAAIQAEYSGAINGEASKQVDAMVDFRSLVDSFDFEAFPWSESYLDWETFQIIYRELVQGLGLCLLAVFVLTLILIAHPTTALLVFLCVTLTIVDVLGIMYFWDLSIDTVAVINLVLAVGLSVDYAAHVGHSFMIKAGTRDERMVQAISDIGVAVIHGGVSTFLAVVLLSQSSSYVFRVLFKQFFSTAVMGLGHGLILLPVLLSLVGPAAYP
eukprot:jgi/Undpi1/11645/HiC_scaffold_36.g13940.m1